MANNSIEQALLTLASTCRLTLRTKSNSISGLVAEYIVAIDVTRVRFPADAQFGQNWHLLGADWAQ